MVRSWVGYGLTLASRPGCFVVCVPADTHHSLSAAAAARATGTMIASVGLFCCHAQHPQGACLLLESITRKPWLNSTIQLARGEVQHLHREEAGVKATCIKAAAKAPPGVQGPRSPASQHISIYGRMSKATPHPSLGKPVAPRQGLHTHGTEHVLHWHRCCIVRGGAWSPTTPSTFICCAGKNRHLSLESCCGLLKRHFIARCADTSRVQGMHTLVECCGKPQAHPISSSP